MSEDPAAPRDPSARTAEDLQLPGGSFRLLVQKLGYQALIGMGVLENPLTRTAERNLDGARAVIDDLVMLREKTRGNLEADEEAHLDRVIADLERHLGSLAETPGPP